jgi:hypothetical protein
MMHTQQVKQVMEGHKALALNGKTVVALTLNYPLLGSISFDMSHPIYFHPL